MELAFSWDSESGDWLGFFVQLHLPESGSKVQCRENAGIGSTDVTDAFGDLLHGVFVNVRILVKLSEILYDPESLSLLFRHTENR